MAIIYHSAMSSIPWKQLAKSDVEKFPATTNIKPMKHLPKKWEYKKVSKIIMDHPFVPKSNKISRKETDYTRRNLIWIPNMMISTYETRLVYLLKFQECMFFVAAVNLVQVVGSLGFLQWYCSLTYLDLHKMLGKSKTYSPKWWFDGDLPWNCNCNVTLTWQPLG